jgi:hypothetical protein
MGVKLGLFAKWNSTAHLLFLEHAGKHELILGHFSLQLPVS